MQVRRTSTCKSIPVNASSDSAGTPPPRLGVIHLLAWLTVAAVLFGMQRSAQVLENAARHPNNFVPHYLALDSIHIVALAAGVVGLGVVLVIVNGLVWVGNWAATRFLR